MVNTIIGLVDKLSKITNHSIFANLAIGVGAFYASFFVPIIPIILTSFGMTLLDCYYGVRVAKLYGKVESRRAWTGTLRKFKELSLVFLATRAIELYVLMGVVSWALAGAFGLVVCLTELWSIIENLNVIDPTGPWKVFGKFMKNKAEQYLGKEATDELTKNHGINKYKTKAKKV